MCIFCDIMSNKIPSYNLYEDDICKVIYDINPINEGHVLVIAKEHYPNIKSCPDDVLLHLMKVVKKVYPIIYEQYNADGITLVENYGLLQEIDHIHFHLVPTFEHNRGIEFVHGGKIEDSLSKFEQIKRKLEE